MSAKRHRHEFSALWTHFGPYGDQNVHIHACRPWDHGPGVEDCDRVLIGEGRDCDGDPKTHRRMTLTENGPKTRA